MSNVQIRGGSLMNCAFSLLKHSIPSVSKTSLNNFLLSQKRNKSTNLDKDLAQNFFFSQHRWVYLIIIVLKKTFKEVTFRIKY